MSSYYISPSGNDTTGDGSSGNPWQTLAKAYTASASGDTIVCKDGTYTFASATMADRTIQAENDGLAIFDGGGANVNWNLSGTIAIAGLRCQDALHSSILNCIFQFGTGAVGSFSNCTFGRDLYCQADGALSVGGMIGSVFATPTSLAISGCVFDDIRQTGSNSSAIVMAKCDCTITNNIFSFRTAVTPAKYAFVQKSGTFSVKNCILKNDSGATVNLSSGTVGITYTDMYNMTGTTAGTGNITSDPLFIDAAGGDFHLAQTSPCRGTGTQP